MSKSYDPRPRYSEELKQAVCMAVFEGKMNLSEAAHHFEIRSISTVSHWIRKFSASSSSLMSKKESEDPEELKKRIKMLEHQLYLEKIRTEGLNTMIDLAEEQLNITIRKKSSTKRSKK